MLDVRNTPADYSSRLSQARKGSKTENKQTKHMTWNKWGWENRNLLEISMDEFEDKFHKEYARVRDRSLEITGLHSPWVRRSSRSFDPHPGLSNEVRDKLVWACMIR